MKTAKLFTGALCILTALLAGCSLSPLAGGGGSDLGNGIIVGHAVSSDGSPAANVRVSLASSDYDPVKKTGSSPMVTGFTDARGRYSFMVTVQTTYSIEAVNSIENTRFLLTGIQVAKDTTTSAPDGRLLRTGSIKVMLPDSFDFADGYVYLPGTNSFVMPTEDMNYVIFDSVPAGLIPEIKCSAKNSSVDQIIRTSVPVSSGDTAVITMPLWKYARTLALNTTAGGANVNADVYGFPLLVRLTASNFDFTQVQPGGVDLRFAKADGTLQPYEIERWDPISRRTEIWVRVDTVFGNDSSQTITLLHGNPAASAVSKSATVFDTSSGFTGVWHLAGLPGETAYDASGNRFNGVPSGMSGTEPVPGVIGACRAFDGVSSAIEMPGTSSGKCNFPENGTYTLSAWVYIDTLADSITQMIVGKGAQQYFMKCFVGQKWEFTEYHAADGWNMTSDSSVMAKEWFFLTGVRSGARQELYVNGTLVSSDIFQAWVDLPPRDTTENVSIGRYLKYHNYYNQGFAFFKGKIDEVRIGNRDMGADWIRLCYMNQKEQDALVTFR